MVKLLMYQSSNINTFAYIINIKWTLLISPTQVMVSMNKLHKLGASFKIYEVFTNFKNDILARQYTKKLIKILYH